VRKCAAPSCDELSAFQQVGPWFLAETLTGWELRPKMCLLAFAPSLTVHPKVGRMRTDFVRETVRRMHAVRRMALLLVVMAAALMVVSGVALAKNIVGTDRGERIVGTENADVIDANGGDDVVIGKKGADRIRGGNGKDKQYGGRGSDIIYSDGGFRDLVNCGKGIDTAYVDSRDQVAGCEKVRR
jgi:RTX calcium-binding nonapeptide repeat (4 copies)